jgi:hypothetical protein
VEFTKQVPFNWQGMGPGRLTSGPGPDALTEERVESAWLEAGANDAEASPAMATTRANTRMATFIFSNLSGTRFERNIQPFGLRVYRSFLYKSIYFK